MFWVLEFSGIDKGQERKGKFGETERNGITQENIVKRMIIKLLTRKIYKTQINRSKS